MAQTESHFCLMYRENSQPPWVDRGNGALGRSLRRDRSASQNLVKRVAQLRKSKSWCIAYPLRAQLKGPAPGLQDPVEGIGFELPESSRR